MTRPRLNERSWAIDVIGAINLWAQRHRRAIRRAGGEATLRAPLAVRFPDVMLFGSPTGWQVLMGWELKLPDTPIDDSELLRGAAEKAELLGCDSFLVWNARDAVLHVRDPQTRAFASAQSWSCPALAGRTDVERCPEEWRRLLEEMLDALARRFEEGRLTPARPLLRSDPGGLVDLLVRHLDETVEALRSLAKRDARFGAEANLWWKLNGPAFVEKDRWRAMAPLVLFGWIARLIFVHVLKRPFVSARAIDGLAPPATPATARALLQGISRQCDFLQILAAEPADLAVGRETWAALLALNALLAQHRLEQMEPAVLQGMMQEALEVSRRKAAGQYVTPAPLADILVRVTVRDREAPVLDPCCGTGTIARAVLDLKRSVAMAPHEAAATTWASDRFAFPVRLATLAVADPALMGIPLQVFASDVLDLAVGRIVALTDPETGRPLERALPAMGAVVSNLPFVRFEDFRETNPRAGELPGFIAKHVPGSMSGAARADLYAFLPFALWRLLAAGGRVGIVVSNAWLGTEWGEWFRRALLRFYRLESVVVSARGRWFAESKVVASLLVLERRPQPADPPPDERVQFAAIRERVQDLNGEARREIADRLLTGRADERVRLHARTLREIAGLERAGLGWNALFADLGWFDDVASRLVPASTFFEIERGERRGWNPLFYPHESHGIEERHLRPVLTSIRHVTNPVAEPDGIAFCCEETEVALRRRGDTGALRWIRRFKEARNEKGRPLREVLARPGLRWYAMRTEAMADLVASVNPDERLFIARMARRGFVDQRLIRFTAREEVDVGLLHALLNSVAGMLYLEAIGFGRGESVLDLSATRLAERLHVLDPRQLSPSGAKGVRDAFEPLRTRDVRPLREELAAPDRISFDEVVLSAFGIGVPRQTVAAALLELFGIRKAALE